MKERVGTFLGGIVLLTIPILIFYFDFVEGMWEGTEFDWLGLISAIVMLLLAIWAIQDGLRSESKTFLFKGVQRETLGSCVKCGYALNQDDLFCGHCGEKASG